MQNAGDNNNPSKGAEAVWGVGQRHRLYGSEKVPHAGDFGVKLKKKEEKGKSLGKGLLGEPLF